MKLSSLARPPIQANEIEGADDAICPNHKGVIAWAYCPADKGRVFFCPIGREYYRFTTERVGINAPLNYQHERPI